MDSLQEMPAGLPLQATGSALPRWTAMFFLLCSVSWLLRSVAGALLRYKVSFIPVACLNTRFLASQRKILLSGHSTIVCLPQNCHTDGRSVSIGYGTSGLQIPKGVFSRFYARSPKIMSLGICSPNIYSSAHGFSTFLILAI
jgi:hypothetical protein